MKTIELSDADKQILETAALQVPWYMICGDFHRVYGGPGALARRLYEMQHEELLQVRSSSADGTTPSAERLEADAIAHNCYEDLESTQDPCWEILTTDHGMAAIGDRLDPE